MKKTLKATVILLSLAVLLASVSYAALDCGDPLTADSRCFADSVVNSLTKETTWCEGALGGPNAGNDASAVGANCDDIPNNDGKKGCDRKESGEPYCDNGNGALVLDMGKGEEIVNAHNDWDLIVKESAASEPFRVFVSNDKANWIEIGYSFEPKECVCNTAEQCRDILEDTGKSCTLVEEPGLVCNDRGKEGVKLDIPGADNKQYRYVKITAKGKQRLCSWDWHVAEKKSYGADISWVMGRTINAEPRNTPPVLADIPDFSYVAASGFQDNIVHLHDYASDAEDNDNELTFTIESQSNQDVANCVVESNMHIDCNILSTIGYTDITVKVRDTGGLTDTDVFRITTTPIGTLTITSLECFPNVIAGHEQDCSVYVEANNAPAGNANVQVYEGSTLLGSCTTNSISGGCDTIWDVSSIGQHTVYATALKAGYLPDNDGLPTFTFNVLTERYDIRDLRVFNDAAFSQEDNDFFRNENMYASFQVYDMFNDEYVTGVVTDVSLISSPGGRIDLAQVAGLGQPDTFYFALTPVPPTHDFLGASHVFAFAFNFTDASGGEEVVDVWIRNNPPVISLVPNIQTNKYTVFTIDLTPYKYDIEDSGSALTWSISGVDTTKYTATIDSNDVLTITPIAIGSDLALLTLTDLDGDIDDQAITVNIIPTQCEDGMDNDGDGLTDYPNDPGCSSPQDNNEADGTSECQDGVDNDNDGATDYPNDFSCSSPQDNDETLPRAQCQDAVDNDNDGFTDYPADPECTSSQDNDEGQIAAQCHDVMDNDADGYIDYPLDLGCSSYTDNSEIGACQDGVDNDNDGLIDLNDPGCANSNDNDESNGTSQCQDGVDNDNDGATDYPNDFSCSSPQDNDETLPRAQCQDGIDNDGDGLIDYGSDPGCASSQDNDEFNLPQCSDGIDNDNDGLTDLSDPGCQSADDNNEADGTTECQDGRDNDNDGYTDYPNDPGCISPQDDDEFNELPQRGLMVQSFRVNGFGDSAYELGDTVELAVTLNNNKDIDLKRISITASIPELGMYRKAGPFTVDSGEIVTKRIQLNDIPEWAVPGIYTVRISVSNDLVTRTVHREIEIV